jgi:hypothetical protein
LHGPQNIEFDVTKFALLIQNQLPDIMVNPPKVYFCKHANCSQQKQVLPQRMVQRR